MTPAACFLPRFPEDNKTGQTRTPQRHKTIKTELVGWMSLPGLRGDGDVASQIMSSWMSESLCGDSPLKLPPVGLDLRILVGVLKSA